MSTLLIYLKHMYHIDLSNTPVNAEVTVTLMKGHLHDPDVGCVAVREVQNEIRCRARSEPNETPARIVQEVTNAITIEEVLMRLPERQTLLRGVNRAQNSERPRNPRNLDELEIEAPYDSTIDGETFLQQDTTLPDGSRLLMFYSENDLRKLCASESVAVDGTFKSVPR